MFSTPSHGTNRFLLPTKEKNILTYRAVKERKIKKVRRSKVNSALQNGEEKNDEIDRPITMTELIWRRDELLKLRKEKLAIICNRLIEEPYAHCKLLPSLFSFCTEQEFVIAITVRKIGLLSTLAVVKDIMPGYKVCLLQQLLQLHIFNNILGEGAIRGGGTW